MKIAPFLIVILNSNFPVVFYISGKRFTSISV